MRALISVSDRSGAVELATRLVALGWEIISSGGTAGALRDGGVDVTEVADVTGVPEMLDGRVKTIHPVVHGGILADRSKPEHLADLAAAGGAPIDLVVCNLYPFASAPSVEMIDIGGPAMLRAAAKNHAHVGVVVDPVDYGAVLEELESTGALSDALRRRLARKAFAHCSDYDSTVVAWLDAGAPEHAAGETSSELSSGTSVPGPAVAPAPGPLDEAAREALPPSLVLRLQRAEVLRYGENPGQQGARYRTDDAASWWDGVNQLGGKQMSYLNVYDADAAWRLVHALGPDPSVVVVKHANPCGAAAHVDLAEAYRRAHACDPVSAFGAVVALNRLVTAEVADSLADVFTEVVVAPGYDADALERLKAKRNLRILQAAAPEVPGLQLRSLGDTFLVQTAPGVADTGPAGGDPREFSSREAGDGGVDPLADTGPAGGDPREFRSREAGDGGVDPLDDVTGWDVVTERRPTDEEWRDLAFAWRVVAAVSSNAIVVAKDRCAVGIGAGQQNRRDAGRIAAAKAGDRGRGGACASDAFLPFADGLDGALKAGCTAVVQPGGSVRDAEVVEAANRHGIAMVFTGQRAFRH
ncbi:MAG: bifunctional phosphoribosylaminoimidazolecarboxamide formyltransferase/IMP cyclohydrolase [bacterium]|nr:bifunctional phosphoribosylaminoimidazolecarboxamide formyltransferase/IMP cyclohydrolase [bacterium]